MRSLDRPLRLGDEHTVVKDEAKGALACRASASRGGQDTQVWIIAAAALILPVVLAWTAWAKVTQNWVGIAGGLAIVAVLGWAARAGVTDPWITTAARIGLAVVLGWAGWVKVTQPPALQKLAVDAYQLLPDGMIGPVGIGLPILEVVLAALLVAGFATRFGAALAGLLMIVFIAGIASAWARGLKIDCGCFGGGGQVADPPYLGEIMRDVGFLALAGWIAVRPRGRFSVDGMLGLYEN